MGRFFSFAPKSLAAMHRKLYPHCMFRTIIACTFLIWAASGHAEVYRWTDDQGNLHFSDSAPESDDFEKVKIPPVLSVPAFKVPQQATDKLPYSETDQISYHRFSIIQPEHDTAIRNNAGDLSVDIAMEPPLMDDHSIVLFMDGNPVAEDQKTTFQLSNVDRGTHILHAEIRNGSGKTIKATDHIEFSILRVSVLN